MAKRGSSKAEWNPAPKIIRGRLKEIRVPMGMFDYAVYCVVGPWDDLKKYVEWKGRPDTDIPKARGLHFESYEEYGPIIWIPRTPRSPEDYATLAHEVCHAMRDMMVSWAGMEINEHTDETFCHGVSHVMTTVLTELRQS
jgi:hypothetical protein